jgi:hypothetical protein
MNPSAASLHAQAPTPIRPRTARDRLDEALARIADPHASRPRGRSRRGLSKGPGRDFSLRTSNATPDEQEQTHATE